jgi:2-keto-4-pentenoate hydratase/2-oxohepta-3-ene-1,7-dioic acid hydratase in catechol pathway
MKLVTFVKSGSDRFGAVKGSGVLDLAEAYAAVYPTAKPGEKVWLNDAISFLRGGEAARRLASQLLQDSPTRAIPLDSVQLRPPIPNPSKVLCILANSKIRSDGAKFPVPAEPTFFNKFSSCLVASGGSIVIPKISRTVENEIELALVIGKEGKYISRENAMDYVAGYSVFNDISFRDLGKVPVVQKDMEPLKDWLRNKSLDASAPMGPCLALRDEIPDPHQLRLTLKVNGEVTQDGSTTELLWGIPEIIEAASYGFTLYVGDVISVGTCRRLGERRWLKDGDRVEAEIQGIGVLRHGVRAE